MRDFSNEKRKIFIWTTKNIYYIKGSQIFFDKWFFVPCFFTKHKIKKKITSLDLYLENKRISGNVFIKVKFSIFNYLYISKFYENGLKLIHTSINVIKYLDDITWGIKCNSITKISIHNSNLQHCFYFY